jgi:colicin import membrane protein
MSTAAYAEPYRLPAGVLALVVHSIFFALLYFGFSWNRPVVAPAAMSVELWASLPEQVVAPVELKVEEVIPPPVQEKIAEPEPLVSQIAEPEIIMPEKKLITPKPAMIKPEKLKPVIPKVVEKVKPKPEAQKPVEPNLEARRLANEQAAREQAAQEAAREQAAHEQAERNRLGELAAANGRVVDEYMAKIKAKIRKNVVMPPDVAKDAHGEILVTLLPGGAVLKAELKKSSGNAAYDNAVERAILKSDPLPLPPDAAMFNRFRELKLPFEPEKTN